MREPSGEQKPSQRRARSSLGDRIENRGGKFKEAVSTPGKSSAPSKGMQTGGAHGSSRSKIYLKFRGRGKRCMTGESDGG